MRADVYPRLEIRPLTALRTAPRMPSRLPRIGPTKPPMIPPFWSPVNFISNLRQRYTAAHPTRPAPQIAGLCPVNRPKRSQFVGHSRREGPLKRIGDAIPTRSFLLCSLPAADGMGLRKPTSTMRSGNNRRRIVTELCTAERYGTDRCLTVSNSKAEQDPARTAGNQGRRI